MRRAHFIRFAILSLLLISSGDLLAQSRERHLLAFYNVENLFDTINNPATADEDMLPLADKAWSGERYERKIAQIAQVVADMQCDMQPPAIMALAEVENRQVLEALTSHPTLSQAAYEICHFDSPDIRGIDVALLYRPQLFKPEGQESISVEIPELSGYQTRDILAVWGEFCSEKFLFIVVHWPSRIGGVEATQHLRIACAQRVRQLIDSAMQSEPDLKIVVMGDMNDNPTNRSLRSVLRARRRAKGLSPDKLYNPFARRVTSGSSRYEGRWNHFDNIIISANLLCGTSRGFCFNHNARKDSSAYIFRRDYMCDKEGYPLRTYQGSEYLGGVSDHLPVALILQRGGVK